LQGWFCKNMERLAVRKTYLNHSLPKINPTCTRLVLKSGCSYKKSTHNSCELWHYQNINQFFDSFSHHVVFLATDPCALQQRVPYRMRSSASCLKFQYYFFGSRSSSSCLGPLPLILVYSKFPSIFPSIKWYRRQFPCKNWSIKLAFLRFIACKMFLSSLTLCKYFIFSQYQSNRLPSHIYINRKKIPNQIHRTPLRLQEQQQ